jgi:hypothetical protein
LFLAGLHYNENSTRPVLTDANGYVKLAIQFPKAKKGRHSINILNQESTDGNVKLATQFPKAKKGRYSINILNQESTDGNVKLVIQFPKAKKG